MQELDPGCGIEDFNKVLTEYSFVTSLYSTYDSDTSSGAYVSNLPDDRPEVTNIVNCLLHTLYVLFILSSSVPTIWESLEERQSWLCTVSHLR